MSDKDVDELDSDYGDAEDYERDGDAFRIREPLPLPVAEIHTAEELHMLIHEGHIDLSPPYQRDIVWTESKQIALIESIFRNFYIPPILFLLTTDPDDPNETIRICMDGKQRLTSIQKFFDGQEDTLYVILIEYEHPAAPVCPALDRDPFTKKKYWYTTSASQSGSRSIIPDAHKRMFAKKQITCVEYRGISDAIERDIFQRVQMGVTLTAAEKLQAIASPYAQWINQLELKYIEGDGDGDGLATLIQWDSKRGRDFQCLAQMIYCIESYPVKSEPTTGKLDQWLKRIDPPGLQLKQRIDDALSSFWHIAFTDGLNTPFKKVKHRVSPVEFVFIGVLLDVLRDSSEEARSHAIMNMRSDVRAHHKDIRANGRVMGTLWDFIIKVDGHQARSYANGSGAAARKRRRGRNDDDDDDDDYRPTPVKSLGTAPTTRSRQR